MALEFRMERGLPLLLINRVRDMRVEIAVRAFRFAKRPMQIDAEAVFGISQNWPQRIWRRQRRGGSCRASLIDPFRRTSGVFRLA